MFIGYARVCAEFLDRDQLVFFFSEVYPDFLHHITRIAFTLAGDALDVFRVYDDSGDHCVNGQRCKCQATSLPDFTRFYPIWIDFTRFCPILPDFQSLFLSKFHQFRMFDPGSPCLQVVFEDLTLFQGYGQGVLLIVSFGIRAYRNLNRKSSISAGISIHS